MKNKGIRIMLFGFLLALGMLLALAPTAAMAEGAVATVTKGEQSTDYTSLQDAINNAETGAVVTLQQNVDLGTGATTLLVIPATADLTLDLNGHTISGSTTVGGARIINNNGTLVIRDSSASKTGEIKNISTTNNDCIRTLGNGTDDNHTASMTIESGKISSTVGQVIINQANLKLEKDAVLETTAAYSGDYDNGAVVLDNRAPGIVEIDGATLTSNDGMLMFIYPSSGSNVTIKSGRFTASATRGLIGGSGTGDVRITGGTFNIDPSAMVAQGYCAEEANNLYTVKKIEESTDFTVSSEKELSQALSESSPSKPVKITISGNISVKGNLKLLKGSSITIPQGNSLSIADGGVLAVEGVVENEGTLTIAENGFLANPLSVVGDGQYIYEGYNAASPVYSISSPMGLQWLAVVNNGDMIDDLKVEVTQDIVFPNGVVFQQIPYFCGTFDGMNHTISGLVINAVSSYTGVFTGMSYATIKNVTLDATITANNGTVGGVAGYVLEDTHFQNVKVTGSFAVMGSGYGAAGFVGVVYGQDANESITFENCESSMTISAPNASIVGGFYGTATSNATPIYVRDCTYSGNMTSGGYCATVGGFMSYTQTGKTTVYGHTIKGTVAGVYRTGDFIGGVMVLGADGYGEIKVQGVASVGENIYNDINEAVTAALALQEKKPLSLNQNMETEVNVTLTNPEDVFMLQQNGFTGKFNVTYAGTDETKQIRTREETNITVYYVGPLELNVMFVSEYGTVPPSQTVDYGAKVEEPDALTEAGWAFGGWYKADDFREAWDFDQDTVTQSLTLHAKWALPVAEIDEVLYASLADAVKAAQPNDVITILKSLSFDGATVVGKDGLILQSGDENVTITLTGAMKFGQNNESKSFTLRGNPDTHTTLTIQPDLTNGPNAFRPVAIRQGNTLFVDDGAILQGSSFNGDGGMINVANNATLSLCGGTIQNSSAQHGGAVYVVNGGTCIIKDHGSINNCKAEQGGAVFVEENGVCEIRKDGSITGCSVAHTNGYARDSVNAAGGAVYVRGTLRMSGGEITDCTANAGKGGGVYVAPISTGFTMTGGSIQNCKATEDESPDRFYNDGEGGGVYVGQSTTPGAVNFTVSGGTINGNSAKQGSGVYLHAGAAAAVGGSPVIQNNGINNQTENVYQASEAILQISDVLTPYDDTVPTGTRIGVTMNTPGVFTYGWKQTMGDTADPTKYFFSDSSMYVVKKEGNELKLDKPDAVPATVAANSRVGDGTSQPLVTVTGAPTGGTMQYALGTDASTPPEDGWSDTIPTGSDINTYYVWYKVVGDANHNNSTPVCVEVRIAAVYTITYDANGGFGAPAAQTGNSSDLVLSQTVPTMYTGDSFRVTLDYNDGSGSKSIMSTLHRYYYTFTGWNTERDGSGTSYQPGAVFTGLDSVTLYAQWRAGGEASAPVQLPTPKRDGYDFVGWGKNADAETGVAGRYVPISDVTLYAVWTLKQYTLTFDTDGGTEIAPVTGVAGTEIPAPADPEKFGFLFAGWDREIPATMPDEDITIKAIWKPTQFGTADFILPAALTEIEEEAFEGAAMMAVYVPDTVEVIGANAFKDCELLWKIRLPKDCEIDETAFSGCTAFLVYAPAGGTVEKFCAEQESIIFVPEVAE